MRMNKPDIRVYTSDADFDGGCNCCHAREKISKIEFGGISNLTIGVRLCPSCLALLREVIKEKR